MTCGFRGSAFHGAAIAITPCSGCGESETAKVSSHGTSSGFGLSPLASPTALGQSIDSVGGLIADQFRRFIRFDPFSVRDCTEKISAFHLHYRMQVGCWRSSCAHQQGGNDNKSPFDCSIQDLWISIHWRSFFSSEIDRFRAGTSSFSENVRRGFAAKWLLISLRNASPKSFSFCSPTPGMRRNSVEFAG